MPEVRKADDRFTTHAHHLAHFCAAIPNFRIMEFEGDDVPWNDDLVTHPPMRARQEILVIISGCPGRFKNEVRECCE